ncbi:MAG: hypothetical protein ACE5I4_04215 [Thermoplasmata archaeon]
MTFHLDLQIGALAWATVLSLALLVVAILSYLRSREGRILLIAVAFGAFFVKNLVLAVFLFVSISEGILLYAALFDTAILVSFYFALFRRRSP